MISTYIYIDFGFCAKVNDALTPNTESQKATLITLIHLGKNISPTHFYGYIYIYIYIEREREREREISS